MGVLVGDYDSKFFSKIPEFCNALQELKKAKAEELIDELGHVFAKHNTYKKYGIIMVHRHFTMSDNEILVENVNLENTLSIAVPWNLNGEKWFPTDVDYWKSFSPRDEKNIIPNTWAFDEMGNLKAFEFLSTGENDFPAADFVSDLYEELKRLGVENIFGLRRLRDASSAYEITPKGVRANIVTFNKKPSDITNFIKVVWSYDENGRQLGGLFCIGNCCGNCCGNCKK